MNVHKPGSTELSQQTSLSKLHGNAQTESKADTQGRGHDEK